MATKKPLETPNSKIDKAINALLDKANSTDENAVLAPEVAIKAINTAIAWEKVKHHIRDDDGSFDLDSI